MEPKIEKKWIKNKSDEQAIKDGCYFDLSYAERVKSFCQQFIKLTLDEWHGQPLEFMPFQWEDIIAPLYSWRRSNGTRRFSQASIFLPKNNAKTCLSASLCLFELVASQTPSGLIYVVANTIEEADTCYKFMADMVAQSEELSEVLWVRDNIKTIEYKETRSKLKVISGDRHGKEGKPISFAVYDEICFADNREVFESLKMNCNKRKNSMIITISTAGFKRESIGFEEYRKAEKIISGEIIDTSTLAVIYCAKQDEDWKDIETARKCNPAWNVSVFPDKVKEELQDAINEPRKEASYKTRRLNLFVGTSTMWLPSYRWNQSGMEIDETKLHGLNAWIGWDFAFGKGDLASYVLVVEKEGLIYLLPRFYFPKKGAQRKQEIDHVPVLNWSNIPAYRLTLTNGDTIDPSVIRQHIQEDSGNFNIVEIGYDPTGLQESAMILQADGFKMVPVPQRPTHLGNASSWLERAVIDGNKVKHPNNPILNWCLENCSSKETPMGIHIQKGQGESQRIDGIIASLIGLSRYLAREQDSEPYFYLW